LTTQPGCRGDGWIWRAISPFLERSSAAKNLAALEMDDRLRHGWLAFLYQVSVSFDCEQMLTRRGQPFAVQAARFMAGFVKHPPDSISE